MNQLSQRENLTTRMDTALKIAAKVQAAREGRNLADLLEDAVILYLKSVGANYAA
jgi:hypothetical protein